LLKLTDVPIEVALDLGMAARVYDRLIDHAAEIAGRVVFAISGQTKVVSPSE
jgi:phosphate uptake regulator